MLSYLFLFCLFILFISSINCNLANSKLQKQPTTRKQSNQSERSSEIHLIKTNNIEININNLDIVGSNSNDVKQSGIQLSQPWYTNIIPIYPNEIPKFLSLSFMMFWIVFIFTMTRDTKDALIVTNCMFSTIIYIIFIYNDMHLFNIYIIKVVQKQ